MTIDRIVKYVKHTPHNTNEVILIEMLKRLIVSHGGSLDGPDTPDQPAEHIIYDGGMEK